MQKQYPEYRAHLQGLVASLAKEMTGPMSGFSKLHREAVADGVLSRRVKELIALGISISARCDGCILAHVHDALREGATREEIMQAAKIAKAHDFIVQFTDGYDTVVGERGQRLSGGERQRVSIARAVLRNPRILILDEATSLVDTETEKNIQEALARLVKGRTTFAIAHRLSTLRNANRLMVLEKGKKVEMGTHDELMEKKGIYHKLVELQREMAQIKAVDG